MTESYSAQAHVAVHDRQIIVLGGLIQAERESIFPEVDALDNVPLAGHLLNRIITSPTHTKKYELMVLIRPNILPTPERSAALASRERMPSIRSLEAEFSTEQVQLPQADDGTTGHGTARKIFRESWAGESAVRGIQFRCR